MNCMYCKQPFEKKNRRGRQVYCSAECQYQGYMADKRGLCLKHTSKCVQCGADFTKQWPNTKQRACSRECMKKFYRTVNREELTKKANDWAKANRESRLAIQRRWNNSLGGLACKRKWYEANISDRCRQYLQRYRTDEMVRKLQSSRANSRKALIRSGRDYVCEGCGSTVRLHCHHKDLNPFNRELNNLQWLCIPCHAFVSFRTWTH